jgi:TetR/AcrR family transcriptional regulator, cholesterol catabolism regulator
VTPSTASGTRPRRRIINAALELATEGGYDALQVRTLSDRAGVSSRTIYKHFPSLDSLLIVAVAEQSQDLYRRYTESSPKGRTAATRVRNLITELTEIMTANRTLTVALLRALLSGKPDVVPWIQAFGDVLRTMLASAIAPNGPTARDRAAAEILECIWFSGLIGWATGADADNHLHDLMRTSARALLGTR